jgi:phosphatidate cytidylyltransferase
VAGAQPADGNPPGLSSLTGRSNLVLRVVSSLVLAPLAIAAAYFGGIAFIAFWGVAALAVLWEWDTLVCAEDRNPVLATGAVALVGSALLLMLDRSATATAMVTLGCFGVAALAARARRVWCAAGLLYAGALLVAPVLLRRDASSGADHAFAAILFLFVIVWLTDITAYFVGRAVGGPKLMPRVSPNKTWSGAIGGTAAAVIGGVIVARQFGIEELAAVAVVALVLSAISQVGDLAESAIKRRFNAKDASQLIPGHGGLMDRLDGFVAASIAGTLIGMAHGGFDAPARGLMVW